MKKILLLLSFVMLMLFTSFASAVCIPDPYSNFTGSASSTGGDTIEFYYNGTLNGRILEFWFTQVDNRFYNIDGYTLYIDNVSCGNPYYADDDITFAPSAYTVLKWACDVAVGTNPVFEICNTDIGNSWTFMSNVSDDNGDNFIEFKVNATAVHDGIYSGVTTVNYDPHYYFCYSSGNSTDWIAYYADTFGDFFFEFLHYDQDCYYEVGDTPYIIYNLSDTYVYEQDSYIYRIFDSDNRLLKQGVIPLIDGNASSVRQVVGFSFPYEDDYRIVVYNVSSSGLFNDVVYTSQFVVVCDVDDSSGSGSDGSGGMSAENQIIFAVMISLAFGVGLLLLTHEIITFPAGFCIGIWIFSQPSLGSYNFLPSEVGYGLIIVLVLVGVIVWLLD